MCVQLWQNVQFLNIYIICLHVLVIHTHTYTYIYIYVYIFIHSVDNQTACNTHVCCSLCLSLSLYIYIYVYAYTCISVFPLFMPQGGPHWERIIDGSGQQVMKLLRDPITFWNLISTCFGAVFMNFKLLVWFPMLMAHYEWSQVQVMGVVTFANLLCRPIVE